MNFSFRIIFIAFAVILAALNSWSQDAPSRPHSDRQEITVEQSSDGRQGPKAGKILIRNQKENLKKELPGKEIIAGFITAGLLWIGQGLIAYAARRFSLVKTLMIDLTYRMGSAANVYVMLCSWQKDLRNINLVSADIDDLPLLQPRHEDHVLYRNLQPVLMEGLWKYEVEIVRTVYRYLELMEKRMEVIRTTYEQIIAEKRAVGNPRGSVSNWIRYAKRELEYSVKRYAEYLERLFPHKLKDWKIEAEKNPDFRHFFPTTRKPPNSSHPVKIQDTEFMDIANDFFLPLPVAYSSQLALPLLTVFSILFAVLYSFNTIDFHRVRFFEIILSLASLVFLFICLPPRMLFSSRLIGILIGLTGLLIALAICLGLFDYKWDFLWDCFALLITTLTGLVFFATNIARAK